MKPVARRGRTRDDEGHIVPGLAPSEMLDGNKRVSRPVATDLIYGGESDAERPD
jgi:hypothetical protein